MTSVSVTSLGDKKIKAMLSRIRGGMPHAFAAVAAALHENAVACFRNQADPDGVPWPENTETTLMLRAQGGLQFGVTLGEFEERAPRRRTTTRTRKRLARIVNNAKILIDKGTLMQSLSPQSTGKTASVSTNVPYAHVHQFGNPDNTLPNRPGGAYAPIPARRFLPLDENGKPKLPAALIAEILAIVRDALHAE